MRKSAISAFLTNEVGNVINDEIFDAILALRVVYPDWSLYDILHKLLRTGLETIISSDLDYDLKKYLDNCINPDIPY